MLLFIFTNWDLIFTNTSFNTSHVTLYRFRKIFHKRKSQFQYISCYSLSPHTRVPSLCTLVSIHLMLLFIPLLFRCSIPCCSFNTSHVTLYRNQKQECSHCITVSIHLMLLFIRSSDTTLNGRKCFNTSHVTLYQKIHFYNRRKRQVSIHLMLLFIGKKCQDELFSERFNTSHVTLYREV